MKVKILVIDDEAAMRDAMRLALATDYEVDAAAGGKEGLEKFVAGSYHLVISDLRMPQVDGFRVLEEIRRRAPETPFVVVTAFGSIESAVEAMRRGAHDFLQKPFKADELVLRVHRAMEARSMSLENEGLRAMTSGGDIVLGKSAAAERVLALTERIAAMDKNVLVSGESGVGKEVISRSLHRLSGRRQGPFLTVNCAALSAGLLESELFGHERGAFTGADNLRRGRFELAESGTLLLDEISEIDPHLQAKLLRVAQEKTFERVGSSQTRRADVRIIATTNRDLKAEVRAGRFRQDLYFRMTEFEVRVPPLRERREDIPDLVRHFARGTRFAETALEMLCTYSWPGNVRELRNVVERAAVLCRGDGVTREQIQAWLSADEASVGGPGRDEALAALVGVPLAEIEDRLMELNLRHFGSKERAAQAMGITSRTIYNRMLRGQA